MQIGIHQIPPIPKNPSPHRPGDLGMFRPSLRLRTFPNAEPDAHLQMSLGALPYPLILSFLPYKNSFEHFESNFYNHVTCLALNCTVWCLVLDGSKLSQLALHGFFSWGRQP